MTGREHCFRLPDTFETSSAINLRGDLCMPFALWDGNGDVGL